MEQETEKGDDVLALLRKKKIIISGKTNEEIVFLSEEILEQMRLATEGYTRKQLAVSYQEKR